MSTTNCIFCNILAGKLPISQVYRDEFCTALMDIQPVNPGHMIIVPNDHAAFLSELNEDTGAHMFRIAQRLAQALRRSDVKCEGVNLFLADGEAAFQEIFHVHLHVFPRFEGDGFDLTFGPAYYHKPGRNELDEIAGKIRSVLECRVRRKL
jgi:Diadenosine tetraphosphate (Ap4A) hydrolase and other HIT family hydrolases